MAQVLFISENKLKENTAINEQVDSRELRTAILTTQDVNVQNTLGTRLYEQLKDLVETGDINQPQNAKYKDLLNTYVQPLVIHYAYFYALDNFLVKFMAAGLVQNRTEQGSPIDTKTFLILKNNARDTAQWYDNILRKHLCAKENLYPEYTIDNGDGKLIPERLNPFGKGMAVGYPIVCKDADLFYFGSNITRIRRPIY
jgi:hypothetical protein